jgi:hypothetical protein
MVGCVLNEVKDVWSLMQDNSAQQLGRDMVLENKVDEVLRQLNTISSRLANLITEFNVSICILLLHESYIRL